MEAVFRSLHSLRLFFLMTAAIGWATATYEKGLAGRVMPESLAMFDALITVCALAVYNLVTGGWKKLRRVGRELKELMGSEGTALGLLSLYGAGVGLLGTILLKHHGVADYQMTSLFISLAVGAVGMYAVGDKGLTWDRSAGLLLIGAGGFLALRD